MESVVATVSGYHGAERFNLIKLITLAGANYVGSLSPSVTHLVCWSFGGRKYEIAKKLKMIIVNHRWIEDCIKAGKRLPEDRYKWQSGKEMGPLLLEIPGDAKGHALTKKCKKFSDKSNVQDAVGNETADVDYAGSGLCFRSVLLDELGKSFYSASIPPTRNKRKISKNKESNAHCSAQLLREERDIPNGSRGTSLPKSSQRKGRRLVKTVNREIVVSSDSDKETHPPIRADIGATNPCDHSLDSRGTFLAESSQRKRRLVKTVNREIVVSSDSDQETHPPVRADIGATNPCDHSLDSRGTFLAESSQRKGRRLVKNINRGVAVSDFSDSYQEFYPPLRIHKPCIGVTNALHRTVSLSKLGEASNRDFTKLTTIDEGIEGDEEINLWNNQPPSNDLASPGKDAQPVTERTSPDGCSDAERESQDVASRLPTSMKLSCVICWTEFSPTRGVLPCGHRFCYSCIQEWADNMTSKRKTPLCPLCKSSFMNISKVEDAAISDQKIFSQTIPCATSTSDVHILSDQERTGFGAQFPAASVCIECRSREPEDLLISCHICQIRNIHRYCLDPPLLPWTCIHCQDLARLNPYNF